ncbi:hypothetical protein SMICM304S_07798 [Streptomyces microflavus]
MCAPRPSAAPCGPARTGTPGPPGRSTGDGTAPCRRRVAGPPRRRISLRDRARRALTAYERAIAIPAAAPAPGQVHPVQRGRRPDRLAHIAGEGEADLRRGVRVGETDLVQRDRPAELGPDRRRDRMGCRTLRHHPLGDPTGHRGLVVAKCQTALCSEVVDPPGEPGVTPIPARARTVPSFSFGPRCSLDMRHPSTHRQPPRHRGRRAAFVPMLPRFEPSYSACTRMWPSPEQYAPLLKTPVNTASVLPIPTVKGRTSVWRDCCPCGRHGPRSGVRGPGWGVLLVCGRAPGRALWPGPYGSGLAGYRVGRLTALDSVGWGIPPLHSPRAADRSGR